MKMMFGQCASYLEGLEPAEQAGDGNNPGGLGVRVGTKKRKTTSA
jgi:hypothetical protein